MFLLGSGVGYWAAGYESRYDSNYWHRRINAEKVRKINELNQLLALSNDGSYSREDIHRIYYLMRYSIICCLGGSNNPFSPSREISEQLRIAYRERFDIDNILNQLEFLVGGKPQGVIPPTTHPEDIENLEIYARSGSSKDRSGFTLIKLDETNLGIIANRTIKDMITSFSGPLEQEEIRIVENSVRWYRLGFSVGPGGLTGLALLYLIGQYIKTRREYLPLLKQN